MKKLVTPQNEVVAPGELKWSADAIESLQSLERYTVLKAIEEGKRLSKRVMEAAAKKANGEVTRFDVQNAISEVIEELELSRQQKTPSLSVAE
jgi:hypothetical protein